MITVFARFFIHSKDYKNARVREKYGVLCGGVGILLNILLFIGKLIAGMLSGAISITADAFNNLSDAGSSFISMIGFKLSGRKPDSDHPFGHGRIEYISGMFVAVLIILMAYELLKESVQKILHPELPELNLLVVIILLVSILVKIYMFFYNRSIGRKIESATMEATAKDSLSDTFATTVVLLSAIVAEVWKIPIDGYCGLFVGGLILIAGISAMKDTINPLLGQPPKKELVEQIETIVRCDARIIGIHDLVVHDYGPGRLMISLHAEVPYKEDILELHDLIDTIEFQLREELNCEPVIHMDPIVDDDEEINEAKAEVSRIIDGLEGEVRFHDFRMVKGPTHSNLIFDVVVPYDYSLGDEELVQRIKSGVKAYKENYYCIIHVDKAYTTIA